MSESLTREQWVSRAATLLQKQMALPHEEQLAVVFFTHGPDGPLWDMYPYVPGEEDTYPVPHDIEALGLVGFSQVA